MRPIAFHPPVARLVLASFALLAAGAVAEAEGVWTPVGPAGDAEATRLDGLPVTQGGLLAIAEGILYLSRDAGASWMPVLAGGVRDAVFSPADPRTAWAVTDHVVHRSADGGLTWEPTEEFTEQFLLDLWSDPDDPDVAYLHSFFPILFSEDPYTLFRTADGGETWSSVALGVEVSFFDLAIHPGPPRVLLAGMSSGAVQRSEDDGLTWTLVDPAGIATGRALLEIAADPALPGRFLGSVFPDGGLVESTDAGDSWHPYGAGLPGGAFVRLQFDPESPSTVYASASGRGIFRSLDGGTTWAPIGSGAPEDRPAGTLELALTGDPERLFVASDRGVLAADPAVAAPCAEGEATLCLQGGRFEVRVAWHDFQGGAGDGRPIPLTDDTGGFWFFRDSNVELAAKVLDGSTINGFFWVFYGSLSNVPFTLAVRDTESGEQRFYDNPPRTFASRGDTRGFPAAVPAAPGGGSAAGAWQALPAAAAAAPPSPSIWELIGPPGGPVTALGTAPGVLSTLYAGCADAGLFRSDDGGAHWRLLPSSPGISGGIAEVVRSGADGAVYVRYRTGRLLRSRDGGATWTEAGVPGPGPAEHRTGPIAPDPALPNRIYAGGGFGPYRSTDGGDHWLRLASFPGANGPDPHGISGLAVSPLVPGRVWAATTDEGVFRSEDGGDTWLPASGGLTGPALEVRGLTAVPGAAASLFALTLDGLYKTTDGGDSWAPSGAGLPGPATQIVPDAVSPGRLWALADRLLHVSTDAGASWQAVAGPTSAVDAVTVGAGGVVAGGPTGASRSLDGGESWTPSSAGLAGDAVIEVDVDPDRPSTILAVTSDWKLLRSDDGGESWRVTLNAGPGRLVSLARSRLDPQGVYAGGGEEVLRSDDGGESWHPIGPPPPPDREQRALFPWLGPGSGESLYVSASTTDFLGTVIWHLDRTTDGGGSWIDLWGGFALPPLAFAVHPLDPDLILAGTNAELRRSMDGGQSWQEDATGLPQLPSIEDLAADPAVPGRFLAWVLNAGLFVTIDAGATWSPLGDGLPVTAFGTLLFDPLLPGQVYAAVADGGGLFGSSDGGAIWTPLAGGFPAERLDPSSLELALGGSGPRRLFATTINGVASLPGSTGPCVADDATLCLNDGRFEVRVAWEDFEGGAGLGHSRPLTGDTGAFWFFRDTNLELFVKVLDGRPVNGHWWVFYGSLSNVPFTLTVTDTETGTPRVYENPPRTFASRGDTTAF